MNKKISMEKKIINSNFKFTKKFLYVMIVPIIILLVGVILSFTVGFNLGTDFTGSSSVKVYVNSEGTFEDVKSYDLNDSKDFDIVYEKVSAVFEENELKIVSYRSSSMKYDIIDGQAVEIVFQNNATSDEKINAENETLRQALIAEFEYAGYENAISSVGFSPAQSSYNWAIGILAAVVFGLICAIIYMMFRYDKSSWIVLILQSALDILLFLSLLSIFRLTVNLTIGIAIFATFVMTIINAFVFYSRMKENIKSGIYQGMKNSDMADNNIKQGLFKKIMLYAVMIILTFVLAIIAVEGVREVALAIAIGLVVTFFTSTFFTPVVWSVVYKEKKKKQIQK